MAGLVKFYTRSFERSPYATLLVSNGILMGIGDVCAQTLVGSVGLSGFDLIRTGRFVTFGASIGPLQGAWNKFLELKFPLRSSAAVGGSAASPLSEKASATSTATNPIPGMPTIRGAKLERGTGIPTPPSNAAEAKAGAAAEGVSLVALGKRVAMDQLVMAPLGLFLFLFSMGMLEGLDGEEISQKVKQFWLPVLLVNWQVWPLLQLINFRFVPLRFRVPFASIMGIFWTCFLSWRTSQETPEKI